MMGRKGGRKNGPGTFKSKEARAGWKGLAWAEKHPGSRACRDVDMILKTSSHYF